MTIKRTSSLPPSIILALAALPLLGSMALAQTTISWTTTSPTGDSGNWSNTALWTGGNVPDTASENANFGAYANDRTITVDTSVYMINKLTIVPRTSGFSGKAFTLNSSGGGSLAIGAGGVEIDNGGTAAINVNIDVTANQTWTGLASNPAGNATFAGIVSGVGQITRTAGNTSTFTFTGANTFSGGFINAAQITRIGSSSTVAGGVITNGPLGTGTVTLNGGTLSGNSGGTRTLSNNIVVGGSMVLGLSGSTGALTFSDAGLTTASTFTLGSATNGNVTILRNANTTALTFDQVIAESGGTGQSVNFATTNGTPTITIDRTKTATGSILVGGIALVLNNGAANSGSLIGVNGSITATGSNKFSSGALVADGTSLVADTSTNFSAVSGGKASVYNNGRVSFATDQTQATVSGLFSSDSQVRLGLSSGALSPTVTENYNQSAIGNGLSGLVSASTGTVTYTGTLTSGSDNTFRVGGGLGTLALTGTTLTGSGKSVSFEGGGTVSVTGNQDYTGATTTNGTTVTLSGASGALSGTSGVTLNNSTTLNLTNNGAGTVNANRIADTATLTLNNSNIAVNGTTTGAVAETIGNLTFNAGRDFITVATTPAASTIKTLQFGTLTRNNNALAIFRGDSLGGTGTARNEIKTTSTLTLTGGSGAAGTTTISILPWARGGTTSASGANTFVTYEINGFRALNTSTEFVQANNDSTARIDQAITTAGGATNYNVRSAPGTTGNATLINTASASVTLNSLLIDNTAATAANTYSLNGGTINITSGALHVIHSATQNLTLGTGTLAFGLAEAAVTTNGGSQLTNIGATLTGSNGLSIYAAGGGGIQLSGTNNISGGNGFVLGGTGYVGVDQDGRFGNAANAVTHAGGELRFFSAFTSTRGLTLLGNVGNNTLGNNTTSNTVNWNGNITGAGLLRLVNNASTVGTGGFSLGGTNDYSGGTQIEGINVTGTTNSALGTGTVTLIGANNNVAALTLTGVAPALGGLRGTDGTVTVNPTAATATLTVGSNNDNTVFNGVIAQGASKTASLTKTGTGTLVLGGSNTYTGPTNVNGGTLEIAGGISATGGAASSINVSNGTLLLAARGAVNNSLAAVTLGAGGGSPISGTLALGGGLTGSIETFGSLTLSYNSTLDFGIGSNGVTTGNNLQFSSLTLGGFNLDVRHWSGSEYPVGASLDSGSPATQDRLLFSTGFTNGDAVPQISFYDDNNNFIGTGQAIAFGGGFEIVPIPEPSSTALLGSFALLGLIGWRERRRFRQA